MIALHMIESHDESSESWTTALKEEGGGNQDEAFVNSSVKPAKSSFTASYSECGMCLDRLVKQIAVKPHPSNKRASSNERWRNDTTTALFTV
ncbi:unnamed protein product [Sphagnum compactum]